MRALKVKAQYEAEKDKYRKHYEVYQERQKDIQKTFERRIERKKLEKEAMNSKEEVDLLAPAKIQIKGKEGQDD